MFDAMVFEKRKLSWKTSPMFRRRSSRSIWRASRPSINSRPADRALGILHLDRCVDDFENSPGADERLLHRVDDVGDVVDLPGELFEQAGEDDQAGAEREPIVGDEPAAVAKQHHHIDATEKTD